MAKIIPLFPQKITDPLEHPVVKQFLNDARIASKVRGVSVDGDKVMMQWPTTEGMVTILLNVSLGVAGVTLHDQQNFKALDATVHMHQSKRWIGNLIDDAS